MSKEVKQKTKNSDRTTLYGTAVFIAEYLMVTIAGGGLLRLLGMQYDTKVDMYQFFLLLVIMLAPFYFYLKILNRRLIKICITYGQFYLIRAIIEFLTVCCLVAALDYDMEGIYIPDVAIAIFALTIVVVKLILKKQGPIRVSSTEKE